MKTGTKLGLAALALAVGTFVSWFYLARQVNLPDDRTGFVLVFLGAAALGIARSPGPDRDQVRLRRRVLRRLHRAHERAGGEILPDFRVGIDDRRLIREERYEGESPSKRITLLPLRLDH